MVYLNPDNMTREKRELLLEWITAEGLDPATIANNGRFSAHNGRVSGFRRISLTNDGGENRVLVWNGRFVTVPFNVQQKHSLPEGLI